MSKNLPLIEPGILCIGVDRSAPLPLHSDPNSPDFEGFEVDLMKAVATRLGVSVSYKNALWSEIICDLLERKLDIICTAATVTEERKEILDFSKPYLDIQLAIVVRNKSSIRTFEDLQGRVIGVRIATSAEDFIRKHAQARSILTFHMNTEAYRTLQEGGVDGVIDDYPIAHSFARTTPGLKLAGPISGSHAQYAVMLRKGNEELRSAINDALTEIEADGTYTEIYRKWLGENGPAVK